MRRNEKRNLLKAIEGLSAALKQSLQVAESAVSALVETRALLDQSAANADQWRQLCEGAQNKPDLAILCGELKPVNGWVN